MSVMSLSALDIPEIVRHGKGVECGSFANGTRCAVPLNSFLIRPLRKQGRCKRSQHRVGSSVALKIRKLRVGHESGFHSSVELRLNTFPRL